MAGLAPAIHDFLRRRKDVDARVEPYEIHTSLPSFHP
jgi:hypothetical protein